MRTILFNAKTFDKMTNSEWIAIISVIVLIIGWFLNSSLNRRNEILKEQFKFRLNVLLLMLDTFNNVQRNLILNGNSNPNKELTADLVKALSRLAFFGKKDEQYLSKIIFDKLSADQPIGLELSKLIMIVGDRIKKELRMN